MPTHQIINAQLKNMKFQHNVRDKQTTNWPKLDNTRPVSVTCRGSNMFINNNKNTQVITTIIRDTTQTNNLPWEGKHTQTICACVGNPLMIWLFARISNDMIIRQELDPKGQSITRSVRCCFALVIYAYRRRRVSLLSTDGGWLI